MLDQCEVADSVINKRLEGTMSSSLLLVVLYNTGTQQYSKTPHKTESYYLCLLYFLTLSQWVPLLYRQDGSIHTDQ